MSTAESLKVSLSQVQRLETAQKLIQSLQERENVGRVLHVEGDRFIAAWNFDQALKCCQTSAQLALRAGDTYARAASQFRMGLYYFVCAEGDYDRAANLCKDAALIFHTTDPKRSEGVAHYAVARILQAACDAGLDRWEAALDNALRALSLLQNVPDLAHVSSDFFYRFNKLYAEHLANIAPPLTGAAADPTEGTRAKEKRTEDSKTASADTAETVTSAEASAETSETGAPAGGGASAASSDEGVTPDSASPDTGAPTDAPAPEKPFVGARPQHSRTGAARRSAWVSYMTGLASLFATALLVGAALGVYYILQLDPAFGIGVAIGVGAGVGATVIPIGLLEFMGQLRFTVKKGVAAVVWNSSINRLDAYLDEATHWLRPFRDLLVGWLSTEPRTASYFAQAPVFMPSRGNSAQLSLQYRVEHPALVWSKISERMTPIKRFGIPFPIPASETERHVLDYACKCAAEQYSAIAPSLVQLNDAARSKLLGAALREQVYINGILYDDVNVRTV